MLRVVGPVVILLVVMYITVSKYIENISAGDREVHLTMYKICEWNGGDMGESVRITSIFRKGIVRTSGDMETENLGKENEWKLIALRFKNRTYIPDDYTYATLCYKAKMDGYIEYVPEDGSVEMNGSGKVMSACLSRNVKLAVNNSSTCRYVNLHKSKLSLDKLSSLLQ